MAEICHQERVALRELIDLLPYLKRLVQQDKENSAALQPQPQPVATLCGVVDGLLRDDHFWEWYKEDSVRLYHALTAERKRAVLVKNALNAARKYVEQYRDTSFAKYVIEAVDALDAFDKGAENG